MKIDMECIYLRRVELTLDGVEHSAVERFSTGVTSGGADACTTAVGQGVPVGSKEENHIQVFTQR